MAPMSGMQPNELHRDPAALKGSRLCIEEPPEWVVRHKVKNAPRMEDHPVTLLLLDRQVYPDGMARYTRYVRRLETAQAVQDAGRIELDFDPATQKLLIHAISIFRDGELTNLAKLEDVEMIQRERDLESGIYAGSITALLLLKDVRKGDIIDVETSTISDDAIFAGHYWFSENFEHTIPVARQYFSWLSEDQGRFTQRQTIEEAALEEEETPWGVRRQWSAENAVALEPEPALPQGMNPFKHISLTSFNSWQEVVAEVAAMWAEKNHTGDELPLELEKLRRENSESEVQLIEACVAFVRDNIRYQGVEVGRLGLVPEELATIWQRRYGDCKEKTSMLCWFLRESGFEATPALVSSLMLEYVCEELPAPVFDHVVVHLKYEGKDYWIDPTNISQRGSLSGWTHLPYRKALLVSADTTDFLDIADAPAGQNRLKVTEHYAFVDGTTAMIDICHDYYGANAEGVRNVLDSAGRNAVRQIFTDVVKSTRPQAELEDEMEISDDLKENHMRISAKFKATETLKYDAQRSSYFCEFVPHSVIGKIVGVDDKPRKYPLGLIHPVEVEHVTLVDHPDARGAVVPKVQINNEMIEFESGTRNENKVPELYYRYRSKVPEIPPDAISRYRTHLEQIGNAISMFFECQNVQGGKKRGSARKQKPHWDEGEYHQPTYSGRGGYDPGHATRVPVGLICLVIFVVIKVIVLILANTGP